MQCPVCRLINPDNALRCDCGFDLAQHQPQQIPPADPQVRLLVRVALVLCLWVVLLYLIVSERAIVPIGDAVLAFAFLIVTFGGIHFALELEKITKRAPIGVHSRTVEAHPKRRPWQTSGIPTIVRTPTELIATSAPGGTGTEPEAASEPAGRGTEPMAPQVPQGKQ